MAATADKTVIEGLIKQNGTTIGAVLGRGSVGVAEEGADGKMHATVRIPHGRADLRAQGAGNAARW